MALSLDDFAAHVGEQWEMDVGGTVLAVELTDASPLKESGREGGSFRLEFRGPVDPAYQQGIATFRRDGAEHEIFVVAIGRDPSGTLYEAVFF